MIVDSKITYGFRLIGEGPLLTAGRNTFEFRALAQGEKELIRALASAKVVTILEEDAPAKVIRFPVPGPARDEEIPKPSRPMKRRGRRQAG